MIWRFQPAEPFTSRQRLDDGEGVRHVQVAAAIVSRHQHAQQAGVAQRVDRLVAQPAVDLRLLAFGAHDVGDVGNPGDVLGAPVRGHGRNVTSFSASTPL